MPKLKTHKATAKRFKVTGRGKLKRMKIGRSHLRRKKPRRVRALFSRSVEVREPASRKRVRRLVPKLRR